MTLTSVNLLNLFNQQLIWDQTFTAIQYLLVPDNPLLVDDKVRALCQSSLRAEDAISLNRTEVGIIAQKGKVEFKKIGKGLLGEGHVGTDSQNLGVHFLELIVVVSTRRQLLDSCRCKIKHVKLEDHVLFPGITTQSELVAFGAEKFEVWGLLSQVQTEE